MAFLHPMNKGSHLSGGDDPEKVLRVPVAGTRRRLGRRRAAARATALNEEERPRRTRSDDAESAEE